MPTPIDASADAAAASVAEWQTLFDASVYGAALRLIDDGAVSDVRILQDGRVITGIASAKHRVYIRRHELHSLKIDGECSCGEPSPCAHVAAVMIASSKQSSSPPTDHHLGKPKPLPGTRARSADIPSAGNSTIPQRLSYLIETLDRTASPGTPRAFRLSPWVTQLSDATGRLQPDACPFVARAQGADYPRYVDAQDREILARLNSQHVEGPWHSHGAAGFDLLQRAIASGRACWQSLDGKVLRTGAARTVHFVWEVLSNGDQRLCCDTARAHAPAPTAGPLDFLLGLEPAVYVDTATGECGPLDLPYPLELLRHYWNGRAIAPQDCVAQNQHIASQTGAGTGATAFPALQVMAVRGRTLSTLRAKLVLTANLEPTLHFVYDGTAVDSRALASDPNLVRRLDEDAGIVYETARDRAAEQRLRAQLDPFLAEPPRDGEAWLAFMMNAIPALQALGWDIAIDPDFPYRIATSDDWYADLQTHRPSTRQPHAPNPKRRAHQPQDWFDLRLGVRVDGHPINLLPALVQYLQGVTGQHATHRDSTGQNDALCLLTGDHLLVRLDDGRYLPVPVARIQRIADTLVELCDPDGLSKHHALTLPTAQVGRLAQLALEPNAPTLQSDDPTLLTFIDTVKNFTVIQPLTAPAHFRATLRPYQQEGLGWLQFLRRHALGGILADDMGLGKTVQTLAHLALEKQHGRLRRPALIVAPVSVLGNWQQEIRRFAPELTSLVLHGAKRKDSYAAIDTVDVIVIGYPLLLIDSELLLAREFGFLILDEAQTIKNPRAKVSQMARALRAEHRLCLTGTPMENHLGELWSLFDFVQPGLLGEQRHFQRHYRTPIENSGDARRARALARRVEPFLLRRTKDAVARDLPPKTQIIESIVLDERQRDFYDGIRLGQHRRVREAIQNQGLARSHITVLDALLKLRQACCDPRLVNIEVPSQEMPSAKLDWLSTALPELIAEGRRILLFSQFTSMLRLIETRVTELSIPYCLLTGATRQRTELVKRFQAGTVPLFLISLKAGGTGLNLTAADTIIHYDPWWNPAAENQATDRAHRIGQDKPVFVYKLIAQGTVEEKIMQLQADKHALVNQLYSDKNAAPGQISAADLEALFAP